MNRERRGKHEQTRDHVELFDPVAIRGASGLASRRMTRMR
jgi:hypothetical protein